MTTKNDTPNLSYVSCLLVMCYEISEVLTKSSRSSPKGFPMPIEGLPTFIALCFLKHNSCYMEALAIHFLSKHKELKGPWKRMKTMSYCWCFKNPVNSPVEVGSWYPIVYQGFVHPRWWNPINHGKNYVNWWLLFGISAINRIMPLVMLVVASELGRRNDPNGYRQMGDHGATPQRLLVFSKLRAKNLFKKKNISKSTKKVADKRQGSITKQLSTKIDIYFQNLSEGWE